MGDVVKWMGNLGKEESQWKGSDGERVRNREKGNL